MALCGGCLSQTQFMGDGVSSLFLTFGLLILPLSSLSSTRTLPGFDQSFGWIFCGSNTTFNPSLAMASNIVLASGFLTAPSLPTLLPSSLVFDASKYIGYMQCQCFDFAGSNCGCGGACLWVVEGIFEGFIRV